jgi:membrane carboxypeptidase/penicillin-binding protein
LQALARWALERGLEEVDQRHGFRGPIAHLAGKALDKKRAELVAERKKPLTETTRPTASSRRSTRARRSQDSSS